MLTQPPIIHLNPLSALSQTIAHISGTSYNILIGL